MVPFNIILLDKSSVLYDKNFLSFIRWIPSSRHLVMHTPIWMTTPADLENTFSSDFRVVSVSHFKNWFETENSEQFLNTLLDDICFIYISYRIFLHKIEEINLSRRHFQSNIFFSISNYWGIFNMCSVYTGPSSFLPLSEETRCLIHYPMIKGGVNHPFSFCKHCVNCETSTACLVWTCGVSWHPLRGHPAGNSRG